MSILHPALFSGRVSIVTGGGTGIGRAIASELAKLGSTVVIASRKEDNLSKAAEDINKDVGAARVFAKKCNIRKEEEVKHLMESTVENHGRLDFLVNNGGGQFYGPAATFTAKGWHAVVETNLTGTFYCCQYAYHTWMSENGGSIVNIIADMKKGFPGMTHTGAARAGVDNITKSLAIEWASCGIRINAVAPGIIYSDTAAAHYKGDAPEDIFEASKVRIPARRLGTTAEVSSIVCFLLSPGASYITGVTVEVDGGSSLYGCPWEVPNHDSWPLPVNDIISKL